MAEQVDSEKVIFDLQRSSKCLYLELPEFIADDVSKKVSAAVEVIRTQAEEIERLKAQRVDRPPLGIDKAEVERFIGTFNFDECPTVGSVCDWLEEHGLLLDNQPKQPTPTVAEMVGTLKAPAYESVRRLIHVTTLENEYAFSDVANAAVEALPDLRSLLTEDAPAVKPERIYGVDVPPSDQIPVMEVKVAKVDPLMVWPKLPDPIEVQHLGRPDRDDYNDLLNELIRIRTALGVKEEE